MRPKSGKTESIFLRVEPDVREAAERAAEADHRSVPSLVEKLLVEHLRAAGYLKAPGRRGK